MWRSEPNVLTQVPAASPTTAPPVTATPPTTHSHRHIATATSAIDGRGFLQQHQYPPHTPPTPLHTTPLNQIRDAEAAALVAANNGAPNKQQHPLVNKLTASSAALQIPRHQHLALLASPSSVGGGVPSSSSIHHQHQQQDENQQQHYVGASGYTPMWKRDRQQHGQQSGAGYVQQPNLGGGSAAEESLSHHQATSVDGRRMAARPMQQQDEKSSMVTSYVDAQVDAHLLMTQQKHQEHQEQHDRRGGDDVDDGTRRHSSASYEQRRLRREARHANLLGRNQGSSDCDGAASTITTGSSIGGGGARGAHGIASASSADGMVSMNVDAAHLVHSTNVSRLQQQAQHVPFSAGGAAGRPATSDPVAAGMNCSSAVHQGQHQPQQQQQDHRKPPAPQQSQQQLHATERRLLAALERNADLEGALAEAKDHAKRETARQQVAQSRLKEQLNASLYSQDVLRSHMEQLQLRNQEILSHTGGNVAAGHISVERLEMENEALKTALGDRERDLAKLQVQCFELQGRLNAFEEAVAVNAKHRQMGKGSAGEKQSPESDEILLLREHLRRTLSLSAFVAQSLAYVHHTFVASHPTEGAAAASPMMDVQEETGVPSATWRTAMRSCASTCDVPKPQCMTGKLRWIAHGNTPEGDDDGNHDVMIGRLRVVDAPLTALSGELEAVLTACETQLVRTSAALLARTIPGNANSVSSAKLRSKGKIQDSPLPTAVAAAVTENADTSVDTPPPMPRTTAPPQQSTTETAKTTATSSNHAVGSSSSSHAAYFASPAPPLAVVEDNQRSDEAEAFDVLYGGGKHRSKRSLAAGYHRAEDGAHTSSPHQAVSSHAGATSARHNQPADDFGSTPKPTSKKKSTKERGSGKKRREQDEECEVQ